MSGGRITDEALARRTAAASFVTRLAVIVGTILLVVVTCLTVSIQLKNAELLQLVKDCTAPERNTDCTKAGDRQLAGLLKYVLAANYCSTHEPGDTFPELQKCVQQLLDPK